MSSTGRGASWDELAHLRGGGLRRRVAVRRARVGGYSAKRFSVVVRATLDVVRCFVMDILAEHAAHGALVLTSTHSDRIARLCDRGISLDSTDNAIEVISASIHRSP